MIFKRKEIIMLSNSKYDKIKVLFELSRTLWFIKEHAIKESAREGHEHCLMFYKELEKDLEKNITQLQQMLLK